MLLLLTLTPDRAKRLSDVGAAPVAPPAPQKTTSPIKAEKREPYQKED